MNQPQIYIRGFPKNCKQSELKQLFNKYGTIREVRVIRDYAFIVYTTKQQIESAVKGMDGQIYQDHKLKVQVAGNPRKAKGPQPNDQCRYCRHLGHWQNDCPEYMQKKRRRRRKRSYSSSSSSSSSSESERSRRKRRKDKKIKKKHRKRSYSSSSSSSSQSSSHSSSANQSKGKGDKSQQNKQK